MKTNKKCLVCEFEEFEHFMNVKDHMITKETFKIVKCSNCGFHFTNPIPDANDIGAYYKSEEYISHSSSKKGVINFLYNIVRNHTLKQKVKWLRNAKVGNKLLDVGSGTGHFLRTAKNNGFEGFGIEPDEDARTFAHKEHHVRSCDQKELYNVDSKSIDVITMWHVLEHVYDLEKDVNEMKRILKESGKLFIAVPNLESYDANYYKQFWAAYDVPRHLYHFRKVDVESFFLRMGFELEKVIPMRFDSYYVSMLSEKYKKRFKLFGFVIGFISNRKAKKHGYSSQVYVIRKK